MQLIHQLVYQLKSAIWPSRIILNNNGCFAKRIQQRHKTFWSSADSHLFKTIDLCADSSLAHWKEGMHWQRKLSKKNNSKEFARLHGCRVAHLYQKIKCADSIDFDSLPSHYVIRPTMGNSCNLVFLMANSVNLMDKKAYTIPELKAILANALNKNPHLEFLFEEFVRTESGEYIIPQDYKFYMFYGEVAIIEVIDRLGPFEGSISYYDKNWNELDEVTKGKYGRSSPKPPPYCLDQMIMQAQTLSKAYEIFVRIDFYATDKGAVFGEFTATPGSANYFTPKADKMFRLYWDTYNAGMI